MEFFLWGVPPAVARGLKRQFERLFKSELIAKGRTGTGTGAETHPHVSHATHTAGQPLLDLTQEYCPRKSFKVSNMSPPIFLFLVGVNIWLMIFS